MPAAPLEPAGMPLPEMPAAPAAPRPEPGTKLRPEPRQLPERPAIPPIEPRHRIDDEVLKRPLSPYARRGRPVRFATRVTVAALFLAAVVATVFFSLYLFLPDGPGQRLAEASTPLVVPPRTTDSQAVEEPAPTRAPDDIGALLSEVGANIPPPPSVDEQPEPAALAAERVLEKFLSASDAASRVPLVVPAASEEALEAGGLAGSLPPVTKIEPDSPRFHEVGNLTEFPFAVTFQPRGTPPFQCVVVVRRSGTQQPKVLLPAFLDLMPGGRLAAFAAEESGSNPGTFHVVLEARPGCYDEGIPAPERKFTFRLLPGPFSPEIARAYAADNSRFRKMLEDPESSLRWGTRLRATVTIQWNRSEHPAKPYLEVTDITALDWNP